MYGVTHVALGLLIAHIAWAIFFVTGTAVVPGLPPPRTSWRCLWLVVACTLAGAAIWGFEGFALGLCGLFTLPGMLVAFAANAGAFFVLRHDTPVQPRFWTLRASIVARAFRGPGAVVYAAALLLCVPAVIPDFSSDGVRVHLAYAYEWYRAGRIYAEERMRFPYYAFNTELLYTWMMVARAGRYIPFLSWLMGTLACLGIASLIALLDERKQQSRSLWEQRAASAVYVLMPFSLMLSAVFLRWWPTAMTDAAVCAFFLGIVGTCALPYHVGWAGWLRFTVILGGFFAGMKPTYLFFVPFLAVLVVMAARRWGIDRRTAIALAALLVLLACPWYVLNAVRDGDPTPPVFNLALRGHDPNFTEGDWQAIRTDLQAPRSLDEWATFPVRELLNPQTIEFREYGVSAVVLAIYGVVVIAPLLLLRYRKRLEDYAPACLFGLTALGIVYLVLTSSLTRYTLLVYPALAVCAGFLLLDILGSVRRGVLAAPLIAALCIYPSPPSHEFYHEFYGVYYTGLPQVIPSDEAALRRFVSGYAEARDVLDAPVLKQKDSGNVLLVEAPIAYYVETHGAQPFGDWSGVGRYSDFIDAIDERRALAYTQTHDIGAMVIKRRGPIMPEELEFMIRQLRAGGFSVRASSDAQYLVLARDGVTASRG